MFWVVQENLYNEQGQRDLIAALERGGIPHLEVKFLPFLRRLAPADVDINTIEDVENYPEPEFPTGDGLVMVCGAIALARVAAERGWVPGSFINENFHVRAWVQNLGHDLLSAFNVIPLDMFAELFGDADLPLFVRPCNDDKAFTGTVLHVGEAQAWVEARMEEAEQSGRFPADLEIAVASCVEILGEFRFFVVDGRIVTGSRYKLGSQVLYTDEIPPHVMTFAQAMVDKWQPARAFVIDIAETHDGPRVIEINNFNSAGFYACNVGKIVEAIEAMEF